jgi:hypothetical protein
MLTSSGNLAGPAAKLITILNKNKNLLNYGIKKKTELK